MPTSKKLARPRTPELSAVVDVARELLCAPRALTPQVAEYLRSQHDVPAGETVSWLQRELATLEGYELELLLSPLFTPTRETRERFEDVLGEGHLDADHIAEVVEALVEQGLKFVLEIEGRTLQFPVPPVIIERFVRLTHIDSPLPSECSAYRPLPPEVRCLFRDRIWKRAGSARLIPDLLEASRRTNEDLTSCVSFLTDFVRSHRPGSRDECRRFLENVAAAYEEDLQRYKSGDRSFFSDELRATYAGRKDVDEDAIADHERTIALARALREALGGSDQRSPE